MGEVGDEPSADPAAGPRVAVVTDLAGYADRSEGHLVRLLRRDNSNPGPLASGPGKASGSSVALSTNARSSAVAAVSVIRPDALIV